MTKTYGELKENDIILFHGAKVRIISVIHKLTNDGTPWTGFEIEPANDEAVEILGNYYSHGSYGGNDSLEITMAEA